MAIWKKLLAVFGIALASTSASATSQAQQQATFAAQKAVETARSVDGTQLDYSPESLKHVDRIVLGLRAESNDPSQIQGILFILGAYVGEVIVRNIEGATWTDPPEEAVSAGMEVIGVTTRKGVFLNPVGKVHKLLINGSEDSVLGLYELAKEKS